MAIVREKTATADPVMKVEEATSKGQVAKVQGRSLLTKMAHGYEMEPGPFREAVMATCFPPRKDERDITTPEFAAFLLVANNYGLNPLTKEIYAFRTKAGAIQPIVSIDGWCNLINSKPQLDGIEFDDHFDDKNVLTAITCRIFRKDRSKPVEVTEYMAECVRGGDVWKQWPRRMLRHKALIQCARYAFGFAGIVDPDEADRIGEMKDVTPSVGGEGGPPEDVGPKGADAGPPEDVGPKQENGGETVYGSDGNAMSKPVEGEVIPPDADHVAGLDDEGPETIEHEATKLDPPQDPDPEVFRAWFIKVLAEATTDDDATEIWEQAVDPRKERGDLTASDMTDLVDLFDKRIKEIKAK